MELATLLELLYSASDRSRTVRATVHHRHHPARERELLRARGLYRELPPIPAEEGSWVEPSTVVEATTHLWAARPLWLRWESTFIGDGLEELTSVGVKEGECFWQRFGDGEVHTNEDRETGGTMTTAEERLLDPSPLLGTYRFELGSLTTLLNRRVLEVSASRRPGAHLHDFGPLSDELSLLVDKQRGVLLRTAVVAEGEELSSTDVVEIAFDEPIPPELFRPLR